MAAGYAFSPLAAADLRDIGDHIAARSLGNARLFIEAIGSRIRSMAASPLACPARPASPKQEISTRSVQERPG